MGVVKRLSWFSPAVSIGARKSNCLQIRRGGLAQRIHWAASLFTVAALMAACGENPLLRVPPSEHGIEQTAPTPYRGLKSGGRDPEFVCYTSEPAPNAPGMYRIVASS